MKQETCSLFFISYQLVAKYQITNCQEMFEVISSDIVLAQEIDSILKDDYFSWTT